MVPHAVVDVNPQPLPPQVLVEFSAQPNLQPTGLPAVMDTSFQVQGSFSDSVQSPPGSTAVPTGPAYVLQSTYSLVVSVKETLLLTPVAPTTTTGSVAVSAFNRGATTINGPSPLPVSGSAYGSTAPWATISITYTIKGTVNSVLTRKLGGRIAVSDHEQLSTMGSLTGTVAALTTGNGQEIDFTSKATSTLNNSDSDYVLPTLGGASLRIRGCRCKSCRSSMALNRSCPKPRRNRTSRWLPLPAVCRPRLEAA